MIVSLGDAVCDPLMTETNQGACSDAQGFLLRADGSRVTGPVVGGATPSTPCPAGFVLDPNSGGVCVPATSAAAMYFPQYGAAAPAPGQGKLFGFDPNTAAFIIGGVLIFFLVSRR